MTRKSRERPATTRSALKVTRASTCSKSTHAADLPHARAYAGPPCRDRRLWAVTVLSCPWCRTMHQHRAGETARLLSGRLAKVCPVTGRLK